MNNSTAMTTLTFQDCQFNAESLNGQIALRVHQIGVALGYARPDVINKLYAANADEFSCVMTGLVEVNTAGGRQQVRVFSLRGVHLLAMFSRTKIAKAFRKWVLDILDAVTAPAVKTTADTRTPIRDAVNLLVGKKHLMYPDAYSMIHQRFNVSRIEELPAEQIPQVVEYVHRMAMEGDWLPAEKSPLTLTSDEANNLPALLLHTRAMRTAWKEIMPALQLVDSPLVKKYNTNFKESGILIAFLSRIEGVCLSS